MKELSAYRYIYVTIRVHTWDMTWKKQHSNAEAKNKFNEIFDRIRFPLIFNDDARYILNIILKIIAYFSLCDRHMKLTSSRGQKKNHTYASTHAYSITHTPHFAPMNLYFIYTSSNFSYALNSAVWP